MPSDVGCADLARLEPSDTFCFLREIATCEGFYSNSATMAYGYHACFVGGGSCQGSNVLVCGKPPAMCMRLFV